VSRTEEDCSEEDYSAQLDKLVIKIKQLSLRTGFDSWL
jgi:hypothetical protein